MMECTQRLECTQTQDLAEFRTEKEFPEQIGFLGICGNKYPVKKGPNKIGRDPQTCNIVLNLNSISRQHAVINVLHKNEFMLMDLDSANKTKLLGKSLQPYVPAKLNNGDMIQLGDVFGIFRLLEEETDLPMTQAISIPDTPIQFKHVSKICGKTTVPESPDVSDKDDSFIISSQPKGIQSISSHNFIKPGRTISIQPIGSNKIDNVFWNSSKKSVSLNLDDSTKSLNDSTEIDNKEENINEMETQAVIPKSNKSINDMETQEFLNPKPNKTIHDMETQAILSPKTNKSTDLIHTADTQIPVKPSIHLAETQVQGPSNLSPSKSIHTANTQMPNLYTPIHSLETQIPMDLPKICKVNEQEDMHFDLYADKENDKSINNAETQLVIFNKEKVCSSKNEKSKLNITDDVLFDEVDHGFDDNCESQVISTDNVPLPCMNEILPSNDLIDDDAEIPQSQIIKPQSWKRNNRINSNDSTDCEEIDLLPTQKIPISKPTEDEDTDCEDEMIELNVNKEIKSKVAQQIEIEDTPPQVKKLDNSPYQKALDIADLPTQVISFENVVKEEGTKNNLDFEDLPTQVLQEDVTKAGTNVQEFSEEVISPFKVPSKFVYKAKKKKLSKTPKIKLIKPNNNSDDNYYQDTQDIFDDLCTQVIPSADNVQLPKSPPSNKIIQPEKNTFKSPNIEKNSSRALVLDSSPSIIDAEAKVVEFVSNLSSQDVRDVIGVNLEVAKPRKMGSDGSSEVAKPRKTGSGDSDVEKTPKKVLPFKFMDIDLPNSQEIKTSVSLANKTLVTESSSDSESENNSEQNTPILFHKKKKKPKPDVKQDLIKKFNANALPTRVITRVRKPTSKVLEGDSTKKSVNILKPSFLTEQDDNVDREIISENISRLKNKNDKLKGNDDSGIDIQNNSTNKTETKDEIADVVKRERRKRKQNEDKPDNSVKEAKPKRTYNKTKNAKIDESTSKTVETTLKTAETTLNTVVTTSKTIKTSSKTVEITSKSGKNALKTAEASSKTNNTTLKPAEATLKTVEASSKTSDTTSKAIETNIPNDLVEPSTSKRSTRSTRGKKLTTEATEEPEPKREKRKYTKRQTNPSPEKEVRRSKRQRTVKEEPEPVKSILKNTSQESILNNNTSSTNDQSTVYNISTGSNPESPSLKRPANESKDPISKRARCGNTSLRATPARMMKTQHVLFTAFPYEEVKVKLEKMGAIIVTDVMQSTMLLTQQIKRTFKFLCAVGLGKPIVGPSWVQACADSNIVVDPWLYIIKDEAAEKRFNFSLEKTLRGDRNFLSGWNISSTPSVLPNATEMKLIVECSGGIWQEGGKQWICVSCSADKPLWPALRRRGATLVSTEFILGGVLRQKLEIQANTLN